MTGLDLGRDALIEIAVLVTDGDLTVLGDGVDVVIHADEAALAGMPELVREMHERSGLTEAVRASTVTVAAADKLALDYVRQHVRDASGAPDPRCQARARGPAPAGQARGVWLNWYSPWLWSGWAGVQDPSLAPCGGPPPNGRPGARVSVFERGAVGRNGRRR